MDEISKINEAVGFIRAKHANPVEVGVILGSGLGGFIEHVVVGAEFSYTEIPHFPVSTVEGHSGKLILGKVGDKAVVVMAGRFHYYEGYTAQEVVFPVRVMQALGAQFLFVSNAAGGVNPGFNVGDLMIIKDHISFSIVNPLLGKNIAELGPRFPDMSEPYSKDLVRKAHAIASSLGHVVREGVYYGVTGPTFETRAEYKMIHVMGADAVGMSTVQEVIAAIHCGMTVFAMSVITDLGIREEDNIITHEEVLEAANIAAPKLTSIFKTMIETLDLGVFKLIHYLSMNGNHIRSQQGKRPSGRRMMPLLLFMMAMLTMFSTNAQMRGMMRGMQGMGSRMGGAGSGGGSGGGGGSDSLSFEKRKFSDDSVNVRFRYLDTARYSLFDSSINDFFRRVPLKADLANIGHNGNATRPILFSPLRMPGWDAGFHALDPFALKISDTRFMNTTKPFTELGYLVGSKAEQQISILHTQNVMPDWNFVLEYRLVNAPGTFNSQNTNHNNVRFNSDYTSESKRYHAYLILLSNALQTAENGGVTDESLLVNENPAYDDRFNIPTNLASAAYSSRNFFNVKLITGNRYTDKHLLLRQQYDFGIKDSVVTDSSVVRFFLPKLRLEHTIQSSGYAYHFLDVQARNAENFYKTNYGLASVPDTVDLNSNWSVLKNDFSVIQFPDSKNPLQFLKAGITLQQYSSAPDSLRDAFGNLMLHGEYRNRTRNKKWDMLLYGEFYAAGRDAGNYAVQANLQTKLGQLGSLELGFQNINRSPSYLYARKTAFTVARTSSFNDENVTAINAGLYLNRLKARLTFSYFLQSNYTYFKDYKTVAQYAPLFNFVRAGISRETALGKKWKWYLDLHVQTMAGNAPIHLPLLYTRNRLSYEARPFRNLVIASGIDMRYFSAYFADGYSPLTGQFFYQDKRKLSPRPDITAFTHFRIRSFTAYLRFENLNTATLKYGFGFKQNNIAAPNYPNPGMVFRLGIFWNFVN